jgi:iron(III) transport system ATP-binding protein
VADFIGRSNFLTVEKVEKKRAGEADIVVAGKVLTVAMHPAAAKAEKVVLLVRPESISVKSAKSAGPSVGTVKNVVFYGNHVEYEIETAEGLIGAVVSDPIYGDIVQIGEMAKFDFDSSRCWLLPA